MTEDALDIPGLLARATLADRGLAALSPAACVQALGLDSLTLCLLDHSGLELIWYDPDHHAGISFDLQFTLGQGPTPDAARTGEPVLVPDLHTVPEDRWPAFLQATHHHHPRAVFALPLTLGAIRLGTLTGHRSTPGALTRSQIQALFALAEGAVAILTTPQGIHDMRADQPISLHRAVIHQATGALTVRLNISIDQALIRLRAYAFTHNRSLHDVANVVVEHRSNLDKPPTC
ncbi:GAF and ANTAR domain-containing protein [Streptomyces sp. cg28]|uniref:GAF and ANTAR domain-containing protein n=1 Tax=Streptomyces sp. cg28 TaxID=3403457 RepID=UPI003B217757